MARDVDAALHEIVQMTKDCDAEQAAEYLGAMKAQKRYQRDVY
jgi:sulfite reductase (NADPH) flavoprotein alpha-component